MMNEARWKKAWLTGSLILLWGCSSSEVDMDADGYPADADCDDLAPAVHPGAEEICDNGIDDDCDGDIDATDVDCGAGDDDDTVESETFSGLVLDLTGQAVADATVRFGDVEQPVGADGLFGGAFEGSAQGWTLEVRAPGYLPSLRYLSSDQADLLQRWTLVPAQLGDLGGGSWSLGEGPRAVEFDDSTLFVDSAGEPTASVVSARWEVLDRGAELASLPSLVDAEGDPLVAVAALAAFLQDEAGDPITFSTSPATTATLPLLRRVEGAVELRSWSWDLVTGLWVDVGPASVVGDRVQVTLGASPLVVAAWSPVESTCVSGSVRDPSGQPVRGALVQAVGRDRGTVVSERTTGTGAFCLPGPVDQGTRASITALVGGQLLAWEGDLELPADARSCVTSDCGALGTLELRPRVEDGDGDGSSPADGDCDDRDVLRGPGVAEIAYDGVDQDCDGYDAEDLDGDGYLSAGAGGWDCDDHDAAVQPGAAGVQVLTPEGESIALRLADADAGDVLCLEPGTYILDGPLTFPAVPVRLIGMQGAHSTVLQADGEGEGGVVFGAQVPAGTELRGVTVTGGVARGRAGGGVLVEGSSPLLSELIVRGNRAELGDEARGGGLAFVGSSARLVDVTVSDNQVLDGGFADLGGGIYAASSPALELQRVVVSGNAAGRDDLLPPVEGRGPLLRSARRGAGIYAEDSGLVIDQGLLSGNVVRAAATEPSVGGGLAALRSQVQLNGTRVVANEAPRGAGLWLSQDGPGGPSTLHSVLVVANVALDTGGGLELEGGSPQIVHATVHGNRSGGSGGGLSLIGADVSLDGVLITSNVAGASGGGLWVAEGGALPLVQGSWVFGNSPDASSPLGVDLSSGDPQYLDTDAADPLDWDLRLGEESELAADHPGAFGGLTRDEDGDGAPAWSGPGALDPELARADGIDCDDSDPSILPGALERCNGLDDDCDGAVDQGCYDDLDGDGLAAEDGDCDDLDPDVHPGAIELCDGLDNDCSGAPSIQERDGDGDGDPACSDCDDDDALRAHGLAERCNELDDDCDGSRELRVPNGFATLSSALQAAPEGALICIRPGSYPTSQLVIPDKEVRIVGMPADDLPTIDLEGGQGLQMEGEHGRGTTIENLMILDAGTAGLELTEDSPTLRRVVFRGNSGGGLLVRGGAPRLEAVSFQENTNQGDGGGLRIQDGADVLGLNLAFEQNETAGDGGAASLWDGRLVAVGLIASGNRAGGDGGALHEGRQLSTELAPSALYQATVAGNYAVGEGGAAFLSDASPRFVNSVLARNEALTAGGLFTVGSASPEIEASVVGLNSGDDVGGAWVWSENPTDPTFVQVNIPLSLMESLGDDDDSSGGPQDACDTAGWAFVTEAWRLASSSWDLHLQASSSGIDAGSTALARNFSALDPDGSAPDAGAWGGPLADRWDVDHDGSFDWPGPGAYPGGAYDCVDGTPGQTHPGIAVGMVKPGAVELCDGVDNDCDGELDEGCLVDLDADGLSPVHGDCDDTDPDNFPGNTEICDGVDNDCNGLADFGVEGAEGLEFDGDGDGWVRCADPAASHRGLPMGGGDCDDLDSDVHPCNVEACDGVDSDCVTAGDSDADGVPDDEQDGDGDGWVRCADPTASHVQSPTGGGDCSDDDPDRFPGAVETCDGVDDDCDGLIDEDFDADADTVTSCGPDGQLGTADDDCDDGDARRSPIFEELCDGLDNDCNGLDDAGLPGTGGQESDTDLDGQSECAGDCDDAQPLSFAGNPELCDLIDNSCDGVVDEGFDVDGDGFTTCGPDGQEGTADDDCDDAEPASAPDATEICDGLDNDCDAATDEGFDVDGDGVSTCGPDFDPDTLGDNDCDDGDAANFPTQAEICDAGDNNCDGVVDEGFDADADGVTICGADGSTGTTDDDCDDGDAANFPGNAEVCDAGDNNCDGAVDEGFDTDGDGATTCGADGSVGTADDDCDDADVDNAPTLSEVCDSADNDCDGVADNGLNTDSDGDGHYVAGSCAAPDDDCDDADVDNFPSNPELCDGADQDCDGAVDNGFDSDGDGATTCGADGVTGTADDDCDDGDAARLPGGVEICDALDNDCDDLVDDGFDGDGDGATTCGADGVAGTADDDCDDANAARLPGGVELCDALDNDCDTDTDEGFDVDGDGVTTCGADGAAGTVDDDCDDGDAANFPGNHETCDGVDNTCDGQADEGLEVDLDGDGHYVLGSCTSPGDDCDDTSAANRPGALEACDGQDNDCDGVVDDGFDADSDGVTSCGPDGRSGTADDDCDDNDAGNAGGGVEVCDGADNDCDGAADEDLTLDEDDDGHYTVGGCVQPADDCDDSNPLIYGGAAEECDGLDDDCDGLVDEDLDEDGDGVLPCGPDAVPGTADDDCDDDNVAVFPGATETCDGADEDCDGRIDEDFDADGDGVSTCGADGVVGTADDDCDDADVANAPHLPEVCDSADNDCDSDVDEGLDVDLDGDGFLVVGSCGSPAGDCDDGVAAVYPGATEVCDAVDNDCDGVVDSDGDHDGVSPCGADGVAGTADDDCDDGEIRSFPGAAEICDGVDNDCDGTVDYDYDGDGVTPCGVDGLPGTLDDDCDDDDATAYPGAAEVCDGVDNDCDGVGEPDADGDGERACEGDCDDLEARASSTGSEICDGVDNDCSGVADDGFDSDGDGVSSCGPDGVVGSPDDDCDDSDATAYPFATEECDGLDDDCDGALPVVEQDLDGDGALACDTDCDDERDDALPGAAELCDAVDNDCDPSTDELADGDSDGWGVCADCDDADGAVHPGARDLCDGVDDDCSGDETGCLDCDLSVPADHATVQAALDAATAGQVVCVAAGTYTEQLALPAAGVQLVGLSGAEHTTLDADCAGAAVTVAGSGASEFLVEGFTIRGGCAAADGGGVALSDARLRLRGVVVTSNSAVADGGGVYVGSGGELWLERVRLDGNSAVDGAGLAVDSATAHADGLEVVGNTATGSGGGVGLLGSALLDGQLLWALDNTSAADGGGVAVLDGAELSLDRAVLAGNEADNGGGLSRSSSGQVTLGRAVISGNTATTDGGGVFVSRTCGIGQFDLSGTVLSANTAGVEGGGMQGGCNNHQLDHVVYHGNTPQDFVDRHGDWAVDAEDYNLALDPALVDTSGAAADTWDLHLGSAAPAVDSGDPSDTSDPDGSVIDPGYYGGAGAIDLDGDGYPSWTLPGAFDGATSGGLDCDDRDAALHPANGCQ